MMALAIAGACLALVVAAVRSIRILRTDEGTQRMRWIAGAIREGTSAFLRWEYGVVAIVAIVVAVAITFASGSDRGLVLAAGFLLGAVGSALAGILGVLLSVRANVRAAALARDPDLPRAMRFVFRAGSVTGLGVAGLATLELVACYVLFGRDVLAMSGLLVGASLISLFARVGGGIYTKAADIGADLVGKLEIQIPEDDPRNPAVIADNVGDNVGDCAGMAADVFETFLVTIVAAMALGALHDEVRAAFPAATLYPLALVGCGLLATLAGSAATRMSSRTTVEGALYRGLGVTLVVAAAGAWASNHRYMHGDLGVLAATLIGLAITALLIASTGYYTSARFSPVRRVADAARAGAGPVVIAGLSLGMRSMWLPGLVITGGMLGAFVAAGWTASGIDAALGLYGIGLAATSMLAVAGMIVAIDAFGPIADNAGGIVAMADLPADSRRVTDTLDAVGNTTKAITKGYAIGSAALATLALFAAFTFAVADRLGIAWSELTQQLTLDDPLVVVGLLLGAILPYVFAALLMSAVADASHAVVVEVRRQFREIAGLFEGTARPEYGRCVAIVTAKALERLIVPGAIALAVPLAVGLVLGPFALAGVLLGVIVSGFPLAVMLTTSGAAWDNAKKLVEREGDDTPAPVFGAAVVGDTVGDATKDAAGPAINPLIKVVNSVSLMCVGLFAR